MVCPSELCSSSFHKNFPGLYLWIFLLFPLVNLVVGISYPDVGLVLSICSFVMSRGSLAPFFIFPPSPPLPPFSLPLCHPPFCWSRYFCMVVVSFVFILLWVPWATLSICSKTKKVHSPSCPSDLISYFPSLPSLLQFEQESCFFLRLYSWILFLKILPAPSNVKWNAPESDSNCKKGCSLTP